MRHLETKIIRDNQKSSGFANKITKNYRNLVQTFSERIFKKQINIKNNIYRTVAFTQVLQNLFEVRGSVYILGKPYRL